VPPRIRLPRGRNAYRWNVSRDGRFGLWQRITPPQLFAGSFALLIGLGTLALKLIPGLYTGPELNWLDALFTSTSAVCVTGLIVVDTGTYFTTSGQVLLLVLIQAGGLGMLAFTSLLITVLGRRLSLRAQTLTMEARRSGPNIDVRRLALDVVRFTFVIEFTGAMMLFAAWAPRVGFREALWPAVFHSISAFCNAGFSTYSDSLIGFNTSPITLVIIMILIIFGGIGFVTMEEFYLRFLAVKAKRIRRLSIHSRLVMVTSLILLLGAWPLYATFEWNGSLSSLEPADKICNALFMSTSARTAGFNTIDYATVTDSGNFLTILLMTVGGSPGSTAGGLKTTTFALIMLLAWSRLRAHETTIYANRSIPDETIQRAVGLTVVAFGIVALGVFALATTEQYGRVEGRFLMRMFEAVSAFNTVGLSLGLTPSMSNAGRWVAIVLMFLGRVGPLTMAAALVVRRPRKSNFRYAYEDVVVG
jgi:trk system potassium uptake protein TrkH